MKKKKKTNKKGISPLIATVLILGFTIALAAVIMTWGKGLMDDIKERMGKKTDIELTCANDVAYEIGNVCYINDTALKITIKNEANKQIEKFQVRVYWSDSDMDTTSITSAWGSFAMKTTDIIMNRADEAKKIELMPDVNINGQTVTCATNKETFGNMEGSGLLQCT